MKLEVVWSPAGEAMLLRLPSWQLAARVARAVNDLAATGRGDLRRIGTSRTEFALYAESCCVRLSLNAPERRIDVWTVFLLR